MIFAIILALEVLLVPSVHVHSNRDVRNVSRSAARPGAINDGRKSSVQKTSRTLFQSEAIPMGIDLLDVAFRLEGASA